MANKFLDLENEKPENIAAPVGGGRGRFLDIESPRGSATPEPPKELIDRIPGFRTVDNIVRRLANGATLGLMDRVAGRNEQDEKFEKDSPILSKGSEIVGGIAPGFGAGLAVAKGLPALGKATLPSIMGNAAVSSAALSPIEDIIQGKRPDPIKAAGDAALGAAGSGLFAGLHRIISPDARFRAAGSDLTKADKAGMKDLAAAGDRAGIPLRIPELANEAAPGRAARVEGLDNYAGHMKTGEAERVNFDRGRLPNLSAAVDKVKGIVGSAPETGVRAQTAADAATKRADKLVSASAKPYYDASMDVRVPQRQTIPNIIETRKELYDDRVIEPLIKNADPNSIRVLQQTADAIEGQIKRAGTNAGPLKENALIGQKRGLINEMEAASPDFATGQSITNLGKTANEEIAAGPLGSISKTTKPSTQTRALLDAEPNAGRKAIERLRVEDPTLPRGMLATEINALSKDPVTFGRKLAPTPDAELNIQEMLRSPANGPQNNDWSDIQDIIRAGRARTKAPTPHGGENPDGPVGWAWDLGQNLTSGGITRRMNDAKNIDKLGDPGTLNRILGATGGAMAREAMQPYDEVTQQLLEAFGLLPKKEPLELTVRPRTREATSR